jgi:hypothetical protein
MIKLQNILSFYFFSYYKAYKIKNLFDIKD